MNCALFLCYDDNGDNMVHKEFEKEEKYKLYRSVREILHPTISKKNISNYKIIVEDEYIPLRVAYPKKVSNIQNIIIFIHGNSKITECEEKYTEISTNLAKELEQLVISIDYDEEEKNLEKSYNDIYNTIKYVYKELLRIDIKKENITILGDSTGASIILGLLDRINKELEAEKLILLYPVLSGEYFKKSKYASINNNTMVNHDLVKNLKNYYKSRINPEDKNDQFFNLKSTKKIAYPRTLVISGNVDPLVDETIDFKNKSDNIEVSIIPFAYHGFLNTKDKEIIKEYLSIMKKFIDDKNND